MGKIQNYQLTNNVYKPQHRKLIAGSVSDALNGKEDSKLRRAIHSVDRVTMLKNNDLSYSIGLPTSEGITQRNEFNLTTKTLCLKVKWL